MTTSILGMSDEEFMQVNNPEELDKTQTEEVVTEDVTATDEPETTTEEVVDDSSGSNEVIDSGSEVVEPDTKEEVTQQVEPVKADVDYKSFYEKVLAPITANGKTVEIRTPEEAIQLMQMGANYTKKMQAIAPHRKVLMMLENNGLLDESRLSYLIDLDKKDPEAIKKLVKDAGIDPLEIDTSVESAYKQGNHTVSNEEVAFTTVLEDVKSAPGGVDSLQMINATWDQASKEALWKEPVIMSAMHQQMQSGVYTTISNEVDRLRTLGQIPSDMPFILAYKHVGDAMLQQRNAVPQKQAPVAVRTAAPNAAVSNSAKAAAAASTSSTTKKASSDINPLSMSDDEFLKVMANRL